LGRLFGGFLATKTGGGRLDSRERINNTLSSKFLYRKLMDVLFPKKETLDHVLVALRRIVRSIDLHSKKLIQSHNLTIPQVVLLREIQRRERLSLGDLARSASISNATVTGIIDRLETKKLVKRVRSENDRRLVLVEILPDGVKLLETMPPLLQENFVQKLKGLEKWEQTQILSSLEKVASLMNADKIEASPILAHHSLTDTVDDVNGGKNVLDESGVARGAANSSRDRGGREVRIHCVTSGNGFPHGIDIQRLTAFLHASLIPYEDTLEDIEQGIRDAFAAPGREGGFVLIAEFEGRIAGALVMQKTGMKGYVPENILLFVAVSPEERGRGLGRKLIEHALDSVQGSVKLHVEYENPARRLYERIGFTSKYAEMRYVK
jgi:DNA-binding MarR family transcriptional regulator/ribosomal protein S18 acetylase RimI-like enzyme